MTPASRLLLVPAARREPTAPRAIGRSFRRVAELWHARDQVLAGLLIILALAALSLPLEG